MTRASLEVTADEVEFLSSRRDNDAPVPPETEQASAEPAENAGYTEVNTEELPF